MTFGDEAEGVQFDGRLWELRMKNRICLGAVTTVLAGVAALLMSVVSAAAGKGQPTVWGLNLQEPVTAVAKEIVWFHDILLWIIAAITLFVLILLIIVILRYNEKANPTPSKTTHNTAIEVAWTVIPVLILLGILPFSLRSLYHQYDFPKAEVVIKAIGNQWYWDYEYPDQGISFASNMVTDEDVIKTNLTKSLGDEDKADEAFEAKFGNAEGLERLRLLREASTGLWKKQGMVRLLSTDTDVVVPVNKVVHVLIQANDVIHNWTVPSFGVKMDAVPGRTTAVWFKAEKTGTYYGQCSELCGIRHAFMPITVQVVDDDLYNKWIAARKADDEDKINAVRNQIREANNRDGAKTYASHDKK